MPGSPYYNLSELVSKWLSIVPESQIRYSSKHTADAIKGTALDNDGIMISFNVSSLYTNVPVDKAISWQQRDFTQVKLNVYQLIKRHLSS